MDRSAGVKKLRVAIDTSFMDGRPGMGTAVFIRKTVEYLRAHRSELDITLIHRKKIPDDPIYQEYKEIVIRELPVPKGKLALSEVFFFLTTPERFDVYYFAYSRLPFYFLLAPARYIVSMQYDGGPDTAGVELKQTQSKNSDIKMSLMRRYVDAFIATSYFGKHGLHTARKLPLEKIYVLYGGVDAIFKPMQKDVAQQYIHDKYHISKGPLIVGSGRLDPHKNIHRLLEAFVILKQRYSIPHRVVVLGGVHAPQYSEQVLARIKELGVEDQFLILKVADFRDMPYFYSAADVMVFPSLYEGFGLPGAEAMRSGVPTVLSNATSLKEVGGDATEFVDPTDVEDIARGIYAVISDSSYSEELVRRGLAHSAQFSWEQHVAGLVKVIRSIVAQ